MTSDPDDIRAARVRAVQLLTTPPQRPQTEAAPRNRKIWSRATEQQRRAMLKDCGWL